MNREKVFVRRARDARKADLRRKFASGSDVEFLSEYPSELSADVSPEPRGRREEASFDAKPSSENISILSTGIYSAPVSRNRSAELPASADIIRHTRLEKLIFDELTALFSYELADPTLEGVLVSGISLSADGGMVKAAVILPLHCHPDRQSVATVLKALERASGFIRVRLSEAMGLKRTPAVRFSFDALADAARRAAIALEAASHQDTSEEESP